ncbi:MAG: threonine synthase [Acidobacteriota bacterium]
MNHILHLKCVICGRTYATDEIEYVCPDHGYEGIVDVVYDYDRVGHGISRRQLAESDDFTIWRYRPLLPVEPDAAPPALAVGWTPLYPAPALEKSLRLKRVWVKDDGRQPTASFKDRASALAVVKARERGAETITTASTGNAAAALAGLCAGLQLSNVIFVPESAPGAKIAQLLVYGSTVFLVRGSYDDAFDLCLQASSEYGWYNRNTAYNPYMSEGKKTASFEICEQLNWRPPDAVLVSVGDGCIIGGLHKGFKDMLALGWIRRSPRLIGVQAAGSNFLAQAWEKGEDVSRKAPIHAHTVADSICAALPRDRIKAMAAVRETGGAFLTVSDEEILAALPALARSTGVFAEPAGAAAYAGLVKARREGILSPPDRVVVVNTGSGLKDVASAVQSVQRLGPQARHIDPSLDSLRSALTET